MAHLATGVPIFLNFTIDKKALYIYNTKSANMR